MKRTLSVGLMVAVLMCGSPLVAQNPNACDQMRTQINQLEQIDSSPLPASLRKLYAESLSKLYLSLTNCLEGEIAATSDPSKLAALRAEKSKTQDKITILRIAFDLNANKPSPDTAARSDEASPAPGNGRSLGNGSSPAPALVLNAASADTTTNTTTPANTESAATGPVVTQLPQGCANVSPGADYITPPPILVDIVNKAAADVVRRQDSQRAIFPLSQMVLYTVFDAASPTSSEMLRKLEAYQYLSETARTDKQLGSSANSDGAVSAIEKPSFASLLGFAVEHGAINKKNDGTNLTLSTSLYSLYAINGGDTAETYQRAGFLNRIGLAASFAVENQTDDLANARRNNLNQWSVKARLFGDRSTRAPGFQRFWNEKVRPLISERLQSLGSAVESLSSRLDSYDSIERLSRRCLPTLVKQRMDAADYAAATAEAKRQMVSDVILSHIRSNVFEQVKTGSLKLSAKEIADVEQEFLPRLKSALDNLVLADAEVKKQIDNLRKGPLGTFAYTNYRTPNGSDYSETKFLFEQDKSFFRPLKLTGNIGLSFYNKPNPALNQERLRDFSASLSFEGTSRSPFTEVDNLSKITYSFVGRYERLFENRRIAQRRPDIGTFQFVMEIPFFKGLSLPLSATYANATEEENKKHFRFNFGMRLDTDKLFELLKAGANR